MKHTTTDKMIKKWKQNNMKECDKNIDKSGKLEESKE
jgi:hypothetical protein